jgi:hypothetical protein
MTWCGGRRAARTSADPHDWNDLDHYLGIHEKCLRDFEFFIVENKLRIDNDRKIVLIEGRLLCEHGLCLDVRKTLDLREDMRVRTRVYSYQGRVQGRARRIIFRYDNVHVHPTHKDAHHCHRFDVSTWEEIKPPVWIGADKWPHLSDAIEDLVEWWNQVGQHFLPDEPEDEPDVVDPLGLMLE